jgi:hypothetical protein
MAWSGNYSRLQEPPRNRGFYIQEERIEKLRFVEELSKDFR